MSTIDFSTDHGQRALNQLNSEQVVWLTTVSPLGTPVPSPVWFIWRDGEVLIFSERKAPKVRNLTANSKVSLAFNTDPHGSQVTILNGTAALPEGDLVVGDFADYVEKYAEGIESLGLTPESMLTQYGQLIIVTPEKLRGW